MQIRNITNKPSIKGLLYCLLFILFAYWPPVVFGYGVSFALQMMIACLLFIKTRARINKRVLILVVVLLLLHILAITFGSYYLNLDLGNVITLVVSLIIVSVIPFNMFATHYSKFMYFICIFSLCTFFINILFPSVFSVFPNVHATVNAHNVFFALIPINTMSYIRNFGMWGEPGMFGVYIILAAALELFYYKSLNKRHIIVIIFTLITTFSTAAYISFAVLFLVFVLSSKSISRRTRIIIIALFSILVLLLINYLFSKSLNHAYVFIKLTETDSDEGTTFERIRAIQTAMKLIWEYFPTGAGWGVYSNYLLNKGTILTATPLNWFALYGFFYGILMNFGIFLGAKRLAGNALQTIGIAAGIVCVILSQEVSSVYIVTIPILYAYAKSYNKRTKVLQVMVHLHNLHKIRIKIASKYV